MSDVIIDGKNLSSVSAPLSGAKFLFTVAYAYHAGKLNPKTGFIELNATLDNHNELLSQIDSLEIFLNDSLSGVGEALAMQDELSHEGVKKLGFLISGLSDIQVLVSDARNIIDESLKTIPDEVLS